MSDYTKIRVDTNHNVRVLFPLCNLSDKQIRKYGLEYIRDKGDICESRLFLYKKWVYDVGEFMCVRGLPEQHPFMIGKWAGHYHESYFQGILIKYPVVDGMVQHDCVIVGRFY